MWLQNSKNPELQNNKTKVGHSKMKNKKILKKIISNIATTNQLVI